MLIGVSRWAVRIIAQAACLGALIARVVGEVADAHGKISWLGKESCSRRLDFRF
jgi:hypothetical protein